MRTNYISFRPHERSVSAECQGARRPKSKKNQRTPKKRERERKEPGGKVE